MFDFDLLERQLNADDPVSVLLRGHLWIESIMEELIRAELAAPDAWPELNRLSWSSKLGLAIAQGNTPDFTAFRVLNRLRNKVAHSPAFEPDSHAAMELAHAVASDIRSDENVYEIQFVLPDTTQSPAEVLRASIQTLIEYLLAALTDLYAALTNRATEQTRRLRELIDICVSESGEEDDRTPAEEPTRRHDR